MARYVLFLSLLAALITPQIITAQAGTPPLNGPIIAHTPAEQDQIILYDLGAGQPVTRALSFGSGEHHVWDFSPDGCRVLFTVDSSENGLPSMYTARLDGSDQQPVITYDELPAGAWGAWEPDWSPRGLIAFTMLRDQPEEDERQHHIAWVQSDGSAPATPDFYSVTGREYTPQWSPDGEWLAYVSYDERVPGADVLSTAVPTEEPPEGQPVPEVPTIFEADIWVVSADAETKYRLTNFGVGSVRAPRWSPDGDLVGFIYSPSPNNDTIWMIGSQQGAAATQLSYFWNLTLDHTWLPDGTAMIAAVRDFRETSENLLWQIPLVGNADETATLYYSEAVYTDYPRFSEDGRYLAYRQDYRVTVLDTQTFATQSIAPNLPGNTPPVWSPRAFNGEIGCS